MATTHTPDDTTDDTADTMPARYRPDPWIDTVLSIRKADDRFTVVAPTIAVRDWLGLSPGDEVGFAPVSETEIVMGQTVPREFGSKLTRDNGGRDYTVYLPRSAARFINIEPPAEIRFHKPADPTAEYPRVRVEVIETGADTSDDAESAKTTDAPSCVRDGTDADTNATRETDDIETTRTTDDTETPTDKLMSKYRRSPQPNSNPIDPTDLLDENGRIDTTKVKSRANTAPSGLTDVSDELCHKIRLRVSDGLTRKEVADELGVGIGTVSNHANGRCMCNPDAPPRRFDPSDGWVIREEGERDADGTSL